MRIIFLATVALAASAASAKLRPLDFDFVAPSVSSSSSAPDQVGLIIYDNTDGVFKGRAVGSWQTLSGTTAGANTSLSNLSSTAINTDLVPASDGGINLGSSSNRVNNLYIRNLIQAPEFTNSFINFYPGDGSLAISGESYTHMVSHSGGTLVLSTNDSAGIPITISSNPTGLGYSPPNSGVTTGDVTVVTGQAYGTGDSGQLNLGTGTSANNSGNVNISTGVASGSRGAIVMNASVLTLPTGTSDPTAAEGSVYYNTSTHKFRLFDGTSWVSLN
jgi:hypothetical protein